MGNTVGAHVRAPRGWDRRAVLQHGMLGAAGVGVFLLGACQTSAPAAPSTASTASVPATAAAPTVVATSIPTTPSGPTPAAPPAAAPTAAAPTAAAPTAPGFPLSAPDTLSPPADLPSSGR